MTLYRFGAKTASVQNLVTHHLEGQKVAPFLLYLLTGTVMTKKGINCHHPASCNL